MAAALLEELRARGFTLDRQDDRLWVIPASSLTEHDAEQITTHKQELLESLAVERQDLVSQLVGWLARCPLGETAQTVIDVYDVCTGTLADWERWLTTAPLAELQRGLRLIELEDTHLGEQSPWRAA